MIHYPAYILPSDLDVRNPNFRARCADWAIQTRSEIKEMSVLTNETIATSRALIEEADRLLAQTDRLLALG
jgi:hypothetical protein